MTEAQKESPHLIFNLFLSQNRKFFADRARGSHPNGNIFVNASYRDEYIVESTMKIACAAADILDMRLVVLPHIACTKKSVKIIRSYNPSLVIDVKSAMFREIARSFMSAFGIVKRVKTGEDIIALKVNEVPVGIHIYDYLLRKLSRSTLKSLTLSDKVRILIELLYYFAAANVLSSTPTDFAILPDNAYRDGMIFELVKRKKLPCIVGIDLNGISMHKYVPNEGYDDHCRTPDVSIVSNIIQTPAVMARAMDYFQNRFSGRIAQHDVMRAFDPTKRSVDRETLEKNYRIGANKKIILVMAHVFRDAPHAYPRLLFKDYEEWLVDTCLALSSNKNVSFLVKGHPSSELYGEVGLTETILAHHGLERAFLPNDVNTNSLFRAVDVVVTCGGTAGMEFPCFGVPVLVAARPSYAKFSYVISPNTKDAYLNEITKIHLLPKLSGEQVREAQAVLFAIQSVMQVPKRELGLGAQEFYLGAKIDTEVFMREMINDCVKPEGYENLKLCMRRLLSGSERNLLDLSKIDMHSLLSNVGR